MDHYCPWTINCIGFNNHKYFLQFLGYSSVGTTTMAASMLSYNYSHWSSLANQFLMNQGGVMSTAVSCLVIPFFLFHLYLTSQNMTTIEFCEERGPGNKRPHIYDLGLWNNFRAVSAKIR